MAETKCGFNDTDGISGSDLLATYGPTLLVDIGFDESWNNGASLNTAPTPGITNINALVDTGATESCIDDFLAAQLKLPIIDKRPISGVGGEHEVNMYLAQIHIPSLKYTIYGAFAGVHLAAGGQPHQALIGRTFLNKFTMIYEGLTGTVTIKSPE
jgi:predicted aspartyl protease